MVTLLIATRRAVKNVARAKNQSGEVKTIITTRFFNIQKPVLNKKYCGSVGSLPQYKPTDKPNGQQNQDDAAGMHHDWDELSAPLH